MTEALDLFAAFYEVSIPSADLVDQFDLTAKASSMADSLSGGQLQRLSITLALINDPDLVFLDEPTTGLDPQARLNLWDVIEKVRARGKTVLITTHYKEEAERLCDRIAVIDRGRIVALDTPERLILEHAPGTSIEFDTVVADPVILGGIAQVSRLDVTDVHVSLRTESPEAVLASLFDSGAPWASSVRVMRDLRVHQGTLEDVFIALTGRTLQS